MFDKTKYLTRGVQEQLTIPLQRALWEMIDHLTIEKDYLQIFELTQISESQIHILHRQEVPGFSSELSIHRNLPKEKLKIYVIDDGEYSTMLLAEEY